jgi:CHAD domain-containing protein
MNQFQRDFGKMEANVETLTKDMEQVKKDLADIKDAIVAKKAVSASDYTRLGIVAALTTVLSQFFNISKFFS